MSNTETMNTDERLAIILTNQVRDIAAHRQRLEREAENWEHLPMDEVLTRQAKHLGNAYERLVEICEALAAGRLRIVDENRAVRVLEKVIDVDRDRVHNDDPELLRYSPLRVGQLALEQLRTTGAIR